jgi:polyphosphate kinase
MYLASADWMTRNLSHRVEVAVPVYDPDVRAQLQRMLEIQLADNRKARIIERSGTNPYTRDGGKAVRAQEALREYLAALAGST